jgi:hypothetical protein
MDRLPRIVLFPLLAALAACGTVPPATPIARSGEFGLAQAYAVGETRVFEDGLAVTLVRIDDSRCKPNVQCIWAGELAPAFELRGGALGDAARAVQLGTDRTPAMQVGAYALGLGPVVVATGAPDSATLTVTPGVPPMADSLRLDTPQPGQVVTSPLAVRGAARGPWYSEASFPVTLLDANGVRLASAPARAQGEWTTPDFVPFSATLDFPPPATATGTLVLENDNPSGDPARTQSRRIDVRFAGPAPAGGGVRGTAHVGPTCPVERTPPDPACADRPYVGVLVVESVGGNRIATATTDAAGRFSLPLPPGSYQLRLDANMAYPRLAPQPFTVRADEWTTLDLALDSGIR